MCDCYTAKCKICETLLPLHLGDYETGRTEIEVFCEKHLPNIDCRIFTLTENEDVYPIGWQMGIRALTDNAREYKDYNHPNLAADWEEKDV
jgi:hypothetical protein